MTLSIKLKSWVLKERSVFLLNTLCSLRVMCLQVNKKMEGLLSLENDSRNKGKRTFISVT